MYYFLHSSYGLLTPLIALSCFAFMLFGVDAWTRQPTKLAARAAFWLALFGLVAAMVAIRPPTPAGVLFARNMLVWDPLSYFFSWITLLTIFFVVLLSDNFAEFKGLRLSTYYGLLLLAGAGLIFLVSSNDFLMIFIGI